MPSFQEQFSNLGFYLLLLNQFVFHNKFSCLSWYSLVKSFAKKSSECVFTGLLCNLFLEFERQFFYSHCYSKSTVAAGTPATQRRLTKAVILLSSLAWTGIAAVFFSLKSYFNVTASEQSSVRSWCEFAGCTEAGGCSAVPCNFCTLVTLFNFCHSFFLRVIDPQVPRCGERPCHCVFGMEDGKQLCLYRSILQLLKYNIWMV